MRIALGIEYDGTQYCGWQYQDHSPSVQAHVEQALAYVADQPIRVICAGRTDTGVHALNQVVHFESDAIRNDRAWLAGSNTKLPSGISVMWAKEVDSEFHARFSAVRRRYRYIILNRAIRPTFLHNRVVWDYRPLKVENMALAATHLVGEHDFNAYRAVACQAKSPVRTVHRLDIQRKKDLVIIDIEANAFLHHMVRNIAGVLMTIGAGEQPPRWCKEVLASKERTAGGVTAPSNGLYLMDISYPDKFEIPTLGESSMLW